MSEKFCIFHDCLKFFFQLLYTDRNVVVCAPTGSGKTVMFELAITRLLMEVPLPWSNIKIVYSKYVFIVRAVINYNNEKS